MNLKNATLTALIGVAVSFLWTVAEGVSHPGTYLVRSAIFNIPLMLFLYTLYRKQA
ncbi:MAG: hypothetical protein L0099_07490 [Acidobacteria bacterium]|nr:hypothetical protein [Acidobacteriota bacterium]